MNEEENLLEKLQVVFPGTQWKPFGSGYCGDIVDMPVEIQMVEAYKTPYRAAWGRKSPFEYFYGNQEECIKFLRDKARQYCAQWMVITSM